MRWRLCGSPLPLPVPDFILLPQVVRFEPQLFVLLFICVHLALSTTWRVSGMSA
jgi:hypothetical protein